jgi:hypothetical protein
MQQKQQHRAQGALLQVEAITVFAGSAMPAFAGMTEREG